MILNLDGTEYMVIRKSSCIIYKNSARRGAYFYLVIYGMRLSETEIRPLHIYLG